MPTLTVYVFHREREYATLQKQVAFASPSHRVFNALQAGCRLAVRMRVVMSRYARELQYLVEAGLSPMQALQAGTGWAAACLGMEGDIGTLKPGTWADIVVVEGDPLEDITVLQRQEQIRLVLKGGTICVDQRRPTI